MRETSIYVLEGDTAKFLEKQLITFDDVTFYSQRKQLPRYDAFILFIDKDDSYVKSIFENLGMFRASQHFFN